MTQQLIFSFLIALGTLNILSRVESTTSPRIRMAARFEKGVRYRSEYISSFSTLLKLKKSAFILPAYMLA